MHVSAKKMAVLGLLLAVDIVMLVLSATIEISTLFFLAAAAFCVGIAVREYGITLGTGFCIASLILGFLFAPQKMYCITYGVMAVYILLSEAAWNYLCKMKRLNRKDKIGYTNKIFWIIRFIIFNIMYIPMIIFAPKLIYSGEINNIIIIVVIAAGQLALVVFEKAYCYFQLKVWVKFRKHIN